MELLVDYVAGFTIFAVALAVATTLLISTSLPPPKIVENYQVQPPLAVKDGVVSSDKPIRIWIVYYDDGWNVLEESTPAQLPEADFIAVFTGVKVAYYEGRAKEQNGYVSRHGFTKQEPEPPYILLRGGKVKEVKDK